MSYRKQRAAPLPTPSSAVTGIVRNGSWFTAVWGATVFLAVVLAQAWNEAQSATRTACIASAWLLGCLLGVRLRYALRRSTFVAAPLWACAYLACALAWQLAIAPWLELSPLNRPAALWNAALLLGAVAFLMGVTSTCWLGQGRPWFAAGEHVSLAREMVCLPLGLFVTWALPQWTVLLGFLFLVPLFVLDLAHAVRLAVSAGGGTDDARSWASAGGPAAWPHLQLDRRGSSRWWWVAYLARRRYIPPTVLATGLLVVTGGIWFSIPTPFVATLVLTHQVRTLYWLIAGTLAALAVGRLILGKSRGVVGASDRLIPQEQQKRAWSLSLLSLFAMAASLVLLGLPYFQAPWWLALWFGLYTLAEGAWAVLLARLRPDISTQAYSLRHLFLKSGQGLSSAQLPYERALEDQATLALSTWEGVLAAAAAPLCGLLIDNTSIDDTFVLVGGALFLFFTMTLLTLRLVQRGPQEAGYQAGEVAG